MHRVLVDEKLIDEKSTKKRMELIDKILDNYNKSKLVKIFPEFSEEQLDQYEYYRRSHLNKGSVKKILQQVSNSNIQPNVTIAVSGITKVFVGELIEHSMVAKKK